MIKVRKILILTMCALTLFGISAKAASVSPALDIIAEEYGFTKVSLVCRDIYFGESDFKNATGLDKIDKISVTGLPDSSVGTLMIGNIAVNEGQSISGKNLSRLRFVPKGSTEASSSFDFVVDETSSGTYKCTLYLLERENGAPSIPTSLKKTISTFENMPVFGAIRAYDPENDELHYEITEMPLHGKLQLTNTVTGSYTYTPNESYVGIDSFEYTACDKYGNRSESAKIYLNIKEAKSNIVFSDLDGHWAQYGAICAVSNGSMSYDHTDNEYLFHPSLPVSRAEFCTALMKNAGYTEFKSISGTGFADDEDIPEEYKGYIAAASVLGVVKGAENEGDICFYPNNQITRAEAAVMAERLYGFSSDIEVSSNASVAVFADSDSIPTWAADSIGTLSVMGIINGSSDGNVSPYNGLTRAEVAVMLANISDVT